jgi:cytochrome c oxidase subunit 3
MDGAINQTIGQRKRIHPYKFTLWVAMGSIIMMFAGLTSAYIVKSNQPKWTLVDLPVTFYYSTAVILASSLTIQLALKEFKQRRMGRYRNLMAVTFVLGVLFILLQILGFMQLSQAGFKLQGSGAAPFLYVIFGLHALHVLGGVIALLIIFLKAFSKYNRNYNPVSIEVISTYWHFVDVLWIYLFIFFMWIQ